MKLSPLEIRKQDFDRSLRGYNPEEVESFLNMVAAQWEEMADERRRLENRVEKLESQLQHYQRVEEALQETLDQTRRNAEQQLENARGKAENIIREAKSDARDIKQEAKAQRDRLTSEVKDLQNRRSQIVARLRAFLASEMEILRQYQEGDFLLTEETDAPSAAYEQLSQSFQLEGWSAPPDAPLSEAGSPLGGDASPDEPSAEDSFGPSAPEDTAPDETSASPLDEEFSRLKDTLGDAPGSEPEPDAPGAASFDDEEETSDFSGAFDTADADTDASASSEDEEDTMSFSSVFGDADESDEPSAGSSSSSSASSDRDGPDRPNRPGSSRRRSDDEEDPSNEEIEKIWRLLDDLE